MNTDELKRLAEGALLRGEVIGEDEWYNAVELHAISIKAIHELDGEFIAAASPAVVLELIQQLEAANRRVAQLERLKLDYEYLIHQYQSGAITGDVR